jgi:hypothetical protein
MCIIFFDKYVHNYIVLYVFVLFFFFIIFLIMVEAFKDVCFGETFE